MAELLNKELAPIKNYKLCVDSKKILNLCLDTSCQASDGMKVMLVLNKYHMEYCLDEEHNFLLYPEYN